MSPRARRFLRRCAAGRSEASRATARADRIQSRVVALTARLSAAEDRAEAAEDRLSRVEAKHLQLRRRLDVAQADALRFAAAAEREF